MPLNRERSQYASPFLVDSLEDTADISPLSRVSLTPTSLGDGNKYSEQWLQRLIFRRPGALPVRDLEPAIARLVPLALEVPTPAGYIDNLYLTPEGHIVLAECKLWRNPEARRMVIAQIIDYAQSMTRWNFDDLDEAVRKGRDGLGKANQRSIMELMRESLGEDHAFDDVAFIDAVQRNLRRGRMLLLVVGDGVREDVEGLVDFLQMHAGFHFTLGLVEMAVFEFPTDARLLIQPRILARTLNIERAVVRVEHNDVLVQAVPSQAKGKVSTLSEEAYFEQLADHAPATVQALQRFAAAAGKFDVYLDPAAKSASLKWDAPSGETFNLGTINIKGKFHTYSVGGVPDELLFLPLAHKYLEQLAEVLGGSVNRTPDPRQWCVKTQGGTLVDANEVLAKGEAWLALMQRYQEWIVTAADRRE